VSISKKISELSDGGALQDADEFPVARSGTNVRISGAKVRAALGGSPSALSKNRLVVIGDSETFNFQGGPIRIGAARAAKVQWGGYFATQGYTLQQIHDTHLPTVLALTGAQKPAACAIFGGTNDIGAGSGGSFVFATSKATHLDICNQLVAANILPILVVLPPRTDFTACKNNGVQWNAYIVGLGAQKGWPVLDLYTPVVTTGGAFVSSGSADGIHLNGLTNRLAGTTIATQLAALFPTGLPAYLGRWQGDPQNLIASTAQLFLGAPTGGIAAGWSGSGTGCVFSVVAGDATIAGDWQTLSRPLAASANAFLHNAPQITTGFAAGDRLALACLYQASAFEANLNQTGYIIVNCRDSGNVTLLATTLVGANASDCSVNAVAYDEFVIPANTANIEITAGVGGAATTTNGAIWQVAQPTLVNLTALELA
jgi:lysophospholipase L1-like esterase